MKAGYRFEQKIDERKKPEGFVAGDRQEFQHWVERETARFFFRWTGAATIAASLWIVFLKWLNP